MQSATKLAESIWPSCSFLWVALVRHRAVSLAFGLADADRLANQSRCLSLSGLGLTNCVGDPSCPKTGGAGSGCVAEVIVRSDANCLRFSRMI